MSATKNKKTTATPRKTIAQYRKENEELLKKIEGAYCYMCEEHKPKDKFYKSTDPKIKSGVTRICKQCAYDIALRKDDYGDYHEPTKESIMQALEYLDKPFLEIIWDASIIETGSEDSRATNVWAAYIKNISMPQYIAMRWRDSDVLKRTYRSMELNRTQDNSTQLSNDEVMDNYEINKKDAIRLIGYDPFASYPRENDKPVLYAKLVSLIDEETKNDGMKMNAVIQVVKAFNQIEKLNDVIDMHVTNVGGISANTPTIKNLSDTVDKFIRSASMLAKDNGISVNHNNNKSKGANTLSGKIKKLNEIGFREAKINTFDIGSCEGMRQVAEISEEARHKQIGYDENIAQEIKDIKAELVEQLTKERDAAKETARLLLVENKDLKEFLVEQGLVDGQGQVIET